MANFEGLCRYFLGTNTHIRSTCVDKIQTDNDHTSRFMYWLYLFAILVLYIQIGFSPCSNSVIEA